MVRNEERVFCFLFFNGIFWETVLFLRPLNIFLLYFSLDIYKYIYFFVFSQFALILNPIYLDLAVGYTVTIMVTLRWLDKLVLGGSRTRGPR